MLTYHNPEAHLVGQIVQARIARLVTRSNSVDVVCLHEKKVLLHEFVGNGSTMNWMMFMTVGTLDDDPFSVHLNETILKLHLAEANTVADNLILSQGQG